MRSQSKRPSAPGPREEKIKYPNAKKENLCFRCLEPHDDKTKKELKGDEYCKKCYPIMKDVLKE